MRKHLLLLFLLLPLSLLSQEEHDLPWPMGLQHRLDSMMRDSLLDTTQMGFMVWDLTAGHSLFSYNHRQILRPASTMKILTAITALDQLGDQHPFTTWLFRTGTITEGTLRGDLYCVGGMDPMFDFQDMDSLVVAVKELGIKRIVGRVVADTSMKDTLRWGEGWCWDDDNNTLTPLLVGRKDNFIQVFLSKMKRAGIDIGHARAAEGRRTRDAELICLRSHTLGDVLHTMMKESDNLYAESTFYQVAASSTNRPARATDAARTERALIERAGLDSKPYRIADGSGLSLYNYLSAELEVAFLRYAYRNTNIYNHLLPSMPIAGVDGTLENRMRTGYAHGNVKAKTGTVTGVSALTGYLTAANGHRLCFSIINQGQRKAKTIRPYQDRICEALCKP